ncbi:conserved phage C-terminal domain-containing protein [Sporosarcina sp. GW1-11]|uniref:conserved phage C-terminal domain-containing protein n=1 Tax=Sporosarcina sp. GW1-11 TaxID=2899126 RepID=UPI00294FE8DD|nr:conserved phage C-terminal domain-containing protein [Sporosarcina sp. GW1-11]MDV6379252.1 conserved phage C-terminal domain-containing protein [Sporosarcina sp. GW1-11]
MKLLIDEDPLHVLPSLARKVGLNGAIFLQKLHFQLLMSKNVQDGHPWVCKTYEEWAEEFTFWSINTIKRVTYDLENKGYLLSTSAYNKMKMDNTKWYRIDYSTLNTQPTWMDVSTLNESVGLPITKERVEMNHDAIQAVIDYLNQQTNKQFKANAAATKKSINARLTEGYTVDDFKRVIDLKVSQWQNDPKFRSYLRPSTLFNPTNFENYLNEVPAVTRQKKPREILRPPVFDFSKGEM